MQRLELMQRVARNAVAYFTRRLPWTETHIPDMTQEAIIAMMIADRLYEPTKGAWDKYAMGAACKAIKRYLHRFRTSVVPARPERGGKPLETFSMHIGEPKYATLVATLSSPSALPSDALDAARMKHRVQQILFRLDRSKKKLGARVLLEQKDRDSMRSKKRMKLVKCAVRNTARRARKSPELAALAAELL